MYCVNINGVAVVMATAAGRLGDDVGLGRGVIDVICRCPFLLLVVVDY